MRICQPAQSFATSIKHTDYMLVLPKHRPHDMQEDEFYILVIIMFFTAII